MWLATRRGQLLAVSLPLVLGAATALSGQIRWTVEPNTSLAWWQVDPHYNHLWATTCPADHSWQPGEGRDPGQYVDYKNRPDLRDNGGHEAKIPLFPRHQVNAVCRTAVSGTVLIDGDTLHWSGVRGEITLNPDSLFSGLAFRDDFARSMVLSTGQYPRIRFVIDSLINVQKGPGDTLHATAVGSFNLHGVTQPMQAPVLAWRDPAGFRVQAAFDIDAQDLTNKYGMSKVALGLGVVLHRWKRVHMGVDVILRPQGG
jgi:polyisoprenoid-binding protein YceI